MKKVRIVKYYLDDSDIKIIDLLLKEKKLTKFEFCKMNKLSRTAFYDLLAGKFALTQRVAEALDKTLGTNYLQVFA